MRRFVALVGLASLLLVACQQFFTTSVASVLTRPAQDITTLSAASATAFMASLAANPDPAAAAKAITAFNALVAANPGDATILRQAASVAVMATGLDAALTKAITTIDITAVMAGGTPDLSTIGPLIDSALANITPGCAEIFAALAAADSATLVAGQVDAQTLVIAATALALNDMNTQLSAEGKTVTDFLNGDPAATYTPDPALTPTLTNLANGAQAIDPNNQLLATLQGLLGF